SERRELRKGKVARLRAQGRHLLAPAPERARREDGARGDRTAPDIAVPAAPAAQVGADVGLALLPAAVLDRRLGLIGSGGDERRDLFLGHVGVAGEMLRDTADFLGDLAR